MHSAISLHVLERRAAKLVDSLERFLESAPEVFGNCDAKRLRSVPYLAIKVRALAAALALADDDDALTIANELADLEALAATILPLEAPTVRPPPKASGTFVIETRAACTNRLLGGEPGSSDRAS